MPDEPLKTDAERCMSSALTYLGYRPRSESEMRKHLQKKNWAPSVIEDVINRLVVMQYIDDRAFARDFVASRARGRPIGQSRIIRDLRRKDIDPDLIEDAIATLPDGYEESVVRGEAERIWDKNSSVPEELRVRRTISYLMRRGFSYSASQSAVRALRDQENWDHLDSDLP